MATQEHNGATPTRRWRLWAGVLLGMTLIGLTFTLNYYLFAHHYVAIFTRQPSLSEMLIWELPYWFLWAALSPVVLRLAERFPPERGRWPRNVGLHVVGCLALTLAHRAAYLLTCWVLHVTVYRQLNSLTNAYDFFFFFNLPTGFMCYALLLLVSYALAYSRYQQESLNISRLEAELAQAQAQTTQAQLQALKMQLQPHFFFNTLHAILPLLHRDASAASEMIVRLGDFLRRTVENSGAQEVTLKEELEFLHCYLEIEYVRFRDRLTVVYEVGPETLEARVPNLILQPLVENAIQHGIMERVGPGRIEIRATRNDGLLRLQVKDNGPGLGGATPAQPTLRHGLGFTRERLERLYATRQRLALADAPEGGLEVTLEIPFVTANAVEAGAQAAGVR